VSALSSTSSDAHARRWLAVRRSFGASMLAKAVSVVCTLAQVPIALHHLGREGYGFWIALLSIGLLMNFVDFGLTVGLQNALAAAQARGDADRLRRTYFTGAACLGVLSLALLALASPIIATDDWSAAFNLSDAAVSAESRPALFVVFALFALGLPLNATARLTAAVQTIWIHSLWIALGSVLALLLAFAAARSGASLTTFVALASLAPLLQGIGMHLHMMRRLRWRHRDVALLPRAEWRAMLGASAWFSAPQIGLALLQTLPPVALAATAGPVAAGAFNILQRLFSPVSQGLQHLLAPVWPAFTEAHVKGDAAWLRRAFAFSLKSTFGFLAALLVVAALAEPLVRFWVGPGDLAGPPALRWSTALWTALLMAAQPFLYFLFGVERLRGLALYGTLGCGLALAGLFVGGHLWGAAGALFAASAGYGAVMLGGLISETRAVLQRSKA
jgi:O-antigen/teichoic acid export membrane protein